MQCGHLAVSQARPLNHANAIEKRARISEFRDPWRPRIHSLFAVKVPFGNGSRRLLSAAFRSASVSDATVSVSVPAPSDTFVNFIGTALCPSMGMNKIAGE